jgi:hypothetical protein
MTYQLVLSDATGNRFALLERTLGFRYSRVINGAGAWSLTLPQSFDRSLFLVDGRVEFWRSGTDKLPLQLEMVGLLRHPQYPTDQNGLLSNIIAGPDVNDLLRRRRVAWPAGSTQARKTDQIDDMMKAIVRENLGWAAGTGRNLSDFPLTVQADVGLGPVTTKDFAWRKVMDVLRELADEAMAKGTPVYFDIVPTTPTTFEFQTFVNQRGIDHSMTGASPVVVGVDFGTLEAPSYEVDYSQEENYIYGGGKGEGDARGMVEVWDAGRIGASPWNRCEGFADARSAGSDNSIRAAADAALQAGRPKRKFGGTLVDTPGCRYGIEWGFGDKVTATYLGQQFTAMITAVTVSVDGNGKETVSARLEVMS